MKLLALVVAIFHIVKCTSYWVTNFNLLEKDTKTILMDHFSSADLALDALEAALRDKTLGDDRSIIECCCKLIQLMQLNQFPIKKALGFLDELLPLVTDEESIKMQHQSLTMALYSYRKSIPSSAFLTLLERPVIGRALRSTPDWWKLFRPLSVPMFKSMLRIGYRPDLNGIIELLDTDVSSYFIHELTHSLTLGTETACSLLYIPERLDWTVVTNGVPEDKELLRNELTDVLVVRKWAERFINSYTLISQLLPKELYEQIRSYIVVIIRQQFDKATEKYSNAPTYF